MKKFFENFNAGMLKEFLASHSEKIWFVIVVAIVTAMAIISNSGYGNLLRSEPVESRHYYYHSDDSRRQTDRKPWKMQKPSSGGSASKSSSSGHK